jgi:glycosyltransferase involved in cell wall biosynthesis
MAMSYPNTNLTQESFRSEPPRDDLIKNTTKLGLALIVKNESQDIERCLRSFIPEVNFACIIDTGSTDDTKEIASRVCLELFKDKVHHVVLDYHEANDENGFINDFSKARNYAAKRLCEIFRRIDYIVSCDADDELITPGIREAIDQNPADFYAIQYRMNPSFTFKSYKIWKAGLGVKWVGRVHETIAVDWKKPVVDLQIVYQHHFTPPAQGMETGTQRNLRILKSEMYPPLRSLFYFANENVDAHNFHEAIKWYLEYIRRVKCGEDTWSIELAHCYFRAARWLAHVGRHEDAVKLSLELVTMDPSWSESWCELAHIAMCKKEYNTAREYCVKALSNKYEPRLFSEQDKYSVTPALMLAQINAILEAKEK